MRTIVNVSENWGIGRKGGLLALIPEDMKRFRSFTKGKVIVVGLNTLKSFPGMKPLAGRVNIVLAESLSMIPAESIAACDCYINAGSVGEVFSALDTPGATIMIACTSKEEVLDIVCLFNGDDVYVSGGASIYKLFLPWCDTALVTKNDSKEEADTFFPNLDSDEDWEMTEEGEVREFEGIHYRYTTYRRKEG